MTERSPSKTRRQNRTMTFALGGALVTAAAVALWTSRPAPETTPHPEEPAAALEPTLQAQAPADTSAAAAPANAPLAGELLESIPVDKYTYLRLRTPSGEVWAAVPTAKLAIGSQVSVENAARMDGFKSKTLGRTFDVIYFGNLADPRAAEAAHSFAAADVLNIDNDSELPPGHPSIASNPAPATAGSDPEALPPGHPEISGASPHGNAALPSNLPGTAPELSLPSVAISRAPGQNGHVIAELSAQRQQLAGQRVRVRGQVTKDTPDVQGLAFFHLRDAADSDLVITAKIPPTRGQVATFEGTLRTDVDVGIGFRYPVLLESAVLVAP